MFGRRKVPFGSRPPEPPAPPPGTAEPFPIDKMDRALEGAILLLTQALDSAGVDMGPLAIRGEVPANVTEQLAECTSFNGGPHGERQFLVLGVTRDFQAMMYPPHCQLYLIINSTGICEAFDRSTLAAQQYPRPLIQAQVMRQWIRYILPTGKAMREGASALSQLHAQISADVKDVLGKVPEDIAAKVDPSLIAEEWCWGFPAAYTQDLTDSTERMNHLPVTPFIGKTLTNFLADMQMRGLSDRA